MKTDFRFCRIRFHESRRRRNNVHWQNGLWLEWFSKAQSNLIKFDTVCRARAGEQKVIWRHFDRARSMKWNSRRLKRILCVTQDEKYFYSSAHYRYRYQIRSVVFGVSVWLSFFLLTQIPFESNSVTSSLFDQRCWESDQKARIMFRCVNIMLSVDKHCIILPETSEEIIFCLLKWSRKLPLENFTDSLLFFSVNVCASKHYATVWKRVSAENSIHCQ